MVKCLDCGGVLCFRGCLCTYNISYVPGITDRGVSLVFILQFFFVPYCIEPVGDFCCIGERELDWVKKIRGCQVTKI